MKLKKILPSILAIAMVLSAMGFTVFASESVVNTEAELKEALATGGEVVLGSDIALTETVTVPAGVTASLDLAGYEITVGYQSGSTVKHLYAILNKGTFTLKDSSTDESGIITSRGIDNQGVMEMNGGKVAMCDSDGGFAILNNYGGEFTLNDGVIESLNAPLNYAAISKDGAKSFDVTGGTIRGIHGTLSIAAGTAKISGGEFICLGVKGQTDNVIYISGSDTSVEITGGTFTHKGAEVNADSGAAVVTSTSSNPKLTISGGSFTGLNGALSGNENTTITGGTFENGAYSSNHYDDVSEYVPEGYEYDAETGKVAEAAPAVSGTLNAAYTSASYINGIPAVFGEATGVVGTESFVVELYSGETLVGTAALVDNDKVLLNGVSKSITWHAALSDDGDSWWSTTWENGQLNINALPDNAKLYVDGTMVDTCNIQLNINELEKPIFAAVTDDNGNVKSFVAGTGYLNGVGENAPVYGTAFKEAIEAVNEGETITLLRDVEITSIGIRGNIVLDLNGHTISTTANIAFQIKSNAEFTIKDTSAAQNGLVKVEHTTGGRVIDMASYDNAKFTLESGNLWSSEVGIYAANATASITINGGSVICDTTNTDSYAISLDEGTAKVTGGTLKANTVAEVGSDCTLEISGGTFSNDVSEFCVDGYKSTANEDGTYGVVATETEPEILKKSLHVTYTELGTYDFLDGKGEVPSIRLSLFAGLDTLNYSEAGFDVTVNGETKSFPVTIAYGNVKVMMNGTETTLPASEFGKGVNYIFGQTINFPATQDFADAKVRWTPYAISNSKKITGNTFELGDIFPGELEVAE